MNLGPRLVAGLCAVWWFLASGVTTAGSTQSLSTDTFAVDVAAPWPHSLRRGYEPIFVTIRNRSTTTREARLRLDGSSFRGRPFSVTDRVECAPRSSVTRELSIPVPFNDTIMVTVIDGDESARTALRPSIGEPDDRPAIVTFSDSTDVSQARVERAVSRIATAAVEHLTFESLPTRVAAYSSLDLVAIDLGGAAPQTDRIDALLGFARSGGVLLITGRRRDDLSSLFPSLAPYLGNVGTEIGDESLSDLPRDVVACGFGRIHLDEPGANGEGDRETGDREPIRSPITGLSRAIFSRDRVPSVPASDEDLAATGRFVPRFAPERIPELANPVDAIPARGALIAILFLFTMAVGPLSFFLARKRGRPILALLFTPAFALLGAASVLGTSVFASGLGVKSRSLTFTYLDQRIHRAASFEMRALHSGLARSFRLDGAAAFCIADYEVAPFRNPQFMFFRRDQTDAPVRLLDLEDGAEYSGGFVPPRRTVRQLVFSESPARARLEFTVTGSPEAPEFSVTNALGVPIENLLVRFSADRYGHLDPADAPLASGSSARLQPLVPPKSSRIDFLLGTVAFDSRRTTEPDTGVPLRTESSWWLREIDRPLHVQEFLAFTDGTVVEADAGLKIERLEAVDALLGAFDLPVTGSSK